MTNSLFEAVAGLALVVAVGAGALLVLPERRAEPASQAIVLDVEAPAVERAEPLPRKSDAERIEDLQRQVREIAEEQKRLRDRVKTLIERRARISEERKAGPP